MIRTHFKSIGLAFLALFAGLAVGCGGESGGLPSGLGGSLQGVKLNTNLITLNVTDTRGVEGRLPDELVTGVTQSVDGGTSKIRLVVKGAGVNSQDVSVDLPFVDPDETTSFPAPDLNNPTADVKTAGNIREIRCYVYPQPSDPTVNVTGAAPPILVRLNPVIGTDKFIFADGVPKTDPGKTADQKAKLAALNASTPLQNASIAGVTTIRYEPLSNLLLRKGTFDVALEFYSALAVTDSAPPFFVSYLKNAAHISATTKQLTLRPESLDGDESAFDPARRFARPITGSVFITGIPSNVRTLRLRVTEYDPTDPSKYLPDPSQVGAARTTYERIVTQDTPFNDSGSGLKEDIIFLNRLRPVALQVEAFLGDSAGKSTSGTSFPAIAVGRDHTTGGALNLTPEMNTVAFDTVPLINRVNAITAQYTGTTSTLLGDSTVYNNAVPKFPAQFNLRASLLVDSSTGIGGVSNGPFDNLSETTFIIPPTSTFIDINDKDGNAITPVVDSNDPKLNDFTQSVGVDSSTSSILSLTLVNVLSTDTASTVQNSSLLSLRLSTDSSVGSGIGSAYKLTIKGVATNPAFPLNVPVTVAAPSAPVTVHAVVAGIPADGSGTLAKSVVVTATDVASTNLVYTKVFDLPLDASSDVSVPVADRSAPFNVSIKAYSGLQGGGAQLASGHQDNVPIIGVGSNPTITLTSDVSTVSLSYVLNAALSTPTSKVFTAVLGVNGVTVPNGLFTYTLNSQTPPGSATLSASDGKVTLDNSDSDTPRVAKIVATYRGDNSKVTSEVTVTTDQNTFSFTFNPTLPDNSYGSIRYSLTEQGGASVYTATSLASAVPSLTPTKTLDNVLSRDKPFVPSVALWSLSDGTGVVLADATAPGSAFSFPTSNIYQPTLVNRVTAVDGATVLASNLEGFGFVRGQSYDVIPTLTVSSVTGQVVPIKLLTVSFGGAGAASLAYDSGTGRITASGSSSATVSATVTLTYKTGTATSVNKVFNVKIKPASGGIGGTIG